MEYKERLRRALEFSRSVVEKMVDDIGASDAWLKPAAEGTNHAMWIVGHLAVADNAFVGIVDPSQAKPHEAFRKAFGRGTQPVLDGSAYPPIDEVLEYFRERRSTLLALLDGIKPEDFERPVPDNSPPLMYDLGSVFHMAAWHESLHAGQLTTIRRMLGHQPIR